MERVYISFALDLLDVEGADTGNDLPERLCFTYFLRLLQQVRTRAKFDALLGRHLAQLESLNHELAEFIRKNDYRFRDEGFGAEGDSWQRISLYVAGSPGFPSLKRQAARFGDYSSANSRGRSVIVSAPVSVTTTLSSMRTPPTPGR